MTYDSQISFTLDTICPWTYLALVRLRKAISSYNESKSTGTGSEPGVNFTIKYFPYQLYPKATEEGEDKYAWYKREKYNDSEEKMQMYSQYMGALGQAEGIQFSFHGTIANTLNAHRLIQWAQESHGEDAANRVVDCKWPRKSCDLLATSPSSVFEC
jgi:predicted DsbA family dithiol-disulfide isomerase